MQKCYLHEEISRHCHHYVEAAEPDVTEAIRSWTSEVFIADEPYEVRHPGLSELEDLAALTHIGLLTLQLHGLENQP